MEALKVRRSRLPWATVLAFTVAALVGGLFMLILQDQARARALGLLGAKASLFGGEADWPTYLGLPAQITAVGGTGVFGLVLVWLFGREFSQRTVKDLLALPTPRTAIVTEKFAVAAVWCLVLTLYPAVFGLVVGAVLGLPGWSAGVAVTGLATLGATAAMTVLVMTPVAAAASAGRGYLPGVGAMLGAVFFAQIVAALGYGHYFPWSVPALFSGVAGADRDPPGAVGVVGVLGTALWWRNADQDR